MARSQIQQDIGGLPDHEWACLQKGRRERRDAALCLHHPHHRRNPAWAACDVDVIGAGLLQREADIFTAALNGRPVIEFIAHRQPFVLCMGSERSGRPAPARASSVCYKFSALLRKMRAIHPDKATRHVNMQSARRRKRNPWKQPTTRRSVRLFARPACKWSRSPSSTSFPITTATWADMSRPIAARHAGCHRWKKPKRYSKAQKPKLKLLRRWHFLKAMVCSCTSTGAATLSRSFERCWSE